MWTVGLERRIILSVALGLAAILFLFGYLAVTAVQQSKDLILQQRLALAETTAGYIDFVLGRTLRQMEETVARSPGGGGDHTATDERRLLSDLYHNLGSFSTVLFADSTGTIVWTEPP